MNFIYVTIIFFHISRSFLNHNFRIHSMTRQTFPSVNPIIEIPSFVINFSCRSKESFFSFFLCIGWHFIQHFIIYKFFLNDAFLEMTWLRRKFLRIYWSSNSSTPSWVLLLFQSFFFSVCVFFFVLKSSFVGSINDRVQEKQNFLPHMTHALIFHSKILLIFVPYVMCTYTGRKKKPFLEYVREKIVSSYFVCANVRIEQ